MKTKKLTRSRIEWMIRTDQFDRLTKILTKIYEKNKILVQKS